MLRRTPSRADVVRLVVAFMAVSLLSTTPLWARDLQPKDSLPDCSKIPLLAITQKFDPPEYKVASLEDMLSDDGVVILHFCSPRPPRRGPFRTFFVEELSALQKAAQSVPYRCVPVAVVPFGDKGREDAAAAMRDTQDKDKPGYAFPVYYEPTYPRPGLYRTLRPGAGDGGEQEIATS